MRVEKSGNGYKCWLNQDEFEELTRAADGYREDLIVRLGGRVGLRSFEIPQVKPKHVNRTRDGEHYMLRIPRGKDTSGDGGKPRDAYLPTDLERDLHRYVKAESIGQDEVIFDISPRWIQEIVSQTAEKAAKNTGNDDFERVSSHDLRRYFAHRMLVEERMNPEVVMEVGGWEDYESIKPYLSKPSEETIVSEFERVNS
ncbi:MAG: site-specific integrase [Halobacteria archaeon]|nr:site-specific integrase [Halobacteria archaeon]